MQGMESLRPFSMTPLLYLSRLSSLMMNAVSATAESLSATTMPTAPAPTILTNIARLYSSEGTHARKLLLIAAMCYCLRHACGTSLHTLDHNRVEHQQGNPGIPAGKIYLSSIIDCFDGMVPTWRIGTSPNAELVNEMLDEYHDYLEN